MRYRLTQDDDGHWYLIEADQQGAFDKWLAAAPYWEGYKGHDFNEDMIDGPHRLTFADPQEVSE